MSSRTREDTCSGCASAAAPQEVELTDTKDGVANFALKFPGDKRQSYVKFLAPGEKHKELEKHKVNSL